MTRQTSLHGWTVPTEGDGNYEDTFDQFFAEVDTDAELRDIESNLQNYDPKSGAKFTATDTENQFIGDGTTWNKLESSGKNPNFDSLSTNDIDITPAETGNTTVSATSIAIIGSETSGYSQVFLNLTDAGSAATVYAELREDFGSGVWQLVNDSSTEITIDWAIVEVADR